MELRPDLSPDQMKMLRGGRNRKYDPLDLLEVIKKTTAKRPISISAWALAAGIPRPTLVTYLSGMRSKGWIATVGEGNTARQHITKQGREILKERSKNV
jgi:predicted transcriptional regulator